MLLLRPISVINLPFFSISLGSPDWEYPLRTPKYKIPEYDIPYYEDNTRISNSAIGWFLNKGPAYFRNLLDGKEKGLDLPQLRKGTMIHEFLLQPDQFWNEMCIRDRFEMDLTV